MCMQHATGQSRPSLTPSQIADLRLASSKLTGPERRSFEAAMTLKYCEGTPLMAEAVFGWGRQTVALGLAESRSGLIGLGAQAACSGRKRWEAQHPQAAQALRQRADAHAHQDPTFRTSVTYTRLTAQAALQALREQGYSEEQLPSPSPLAEVLNRLGYRLRRVVKAKPQKKIKETDAIFEKRKKRGPSHVICRRQTLEYRLESDRADWRVFTRGRDARRPPSEGARYGVQGEVYPVWDCG